MRYLKGFIYFISFILISLMVGIGVAHFLGGTLPERSSIAQSKSFDASQDLIWTALMDIESYQLWKPQLKSVEMLGVNDKGFTKWREFYPYGQSVTYEISQYIPKSLIEVRITESKKAAQGVWVYKISSYQSRGVLQIKRFAIISNNIERFIRRWIDTKYNEVDYTLMSLNEYLNQLLEDQDQISDMGLPDSIQNNEVP